MKVDKAVLVSLCKKYGPFVTGLPDSINPCLLLWAIAGNETSFGQWCVPRHEPEYCPQVLWHFQHGTYISRDGVYSRTPEQRQLHREYGCLACCSLTPWQIMAPHAANHTPLELLTDPEKGAEAVAGFLNRWLASPNTPKQVTLEDIAHMWNGSGVSAEYINQLKQNYVNGF